MKDQIENYLFDYYGANQVLWVEEGIVGDDTDGHIDDTIRFVNEDTVLTVVESNPNGQEPQQLPVHSCPSADVVLRQQMPSQTFCRNPGDATPTLGVSLGHGNEQ